MSTTEMTTDKQIPGLYSERLGVSLYAGFVRFWKHFLQINFVLLPTQIYASPTQQRMRVSYHSYSVCVYPTTQDSISAYQPDSAQLSAKLQR